MLDELFQSLFGGTSGPAQRSQAELDAYRRALPYLNDLDGAIQARVLGVPLPPGAGTWARPRHHHYALVMASVARDLATIATVLLESDARDDPATAGYLPQVTFDQAKALYEQVPAYVTRAWEALANPRYQPDVSLPVPLGPRMEAIGKCPLIYLRGMYAAGHSLDAIGQARLGHFLEGVKSCGVRPNDDVKAALSDLAQLWARAQARFRFSSQQLALVSHGNVPMKTHEDAEHRLWTSLSDQFIAGQLIAMPELLAGIGILAAGRDVTQEARWFLTERRAVADLQGTKFGEEEIAVFWREKRWRTTPREERYLHECAALERQGAIAVVSRWATCPFAPLYQTKRPVTILGMPLPARTEFYLHMDDDEDRLLVGTPRFRRVSGYEEEHDTHEERDRGH
jgi:hypothetical protein